MAVLLVPVLAMFAWSGAALLGLALLVIYVQAKFWGAAFPSIAHLAIAADAGAGLRTAQLYLANILGSALGSVLTGFILMEYLGLVPLAWVLGVLGVAVAIWLAVSTGAAHGAGLLPMGVPGLLAVTALLATGLTQRPHEALQFRRWGAPAFAAVVENRSGIITAADDGTVYGNGVYDGKFNTNLIKDTNGIVRPFALSLFHPQPKRILMIGLASGSWAQVLANHPQLESLTIVEINKGYQSIIADQPEVASMLKHPKVRVVTDDGRRWLRSNGEASFDAIVANATYHFRSNATNLLSQEFLELAKLHLKPGGLLFFNTTDSSRVQKTACTVFAHGARFMNHMVVSNQPIDWNFSRWQASLVRHRIDGRPVIDTAQSADRNRLAELMLLESHLQVAGDAASKDSIEPCTEVLSRTQGQMLITDDNMGTEWRYPLGVQ